MPKEENATTMRAHCKHNYPLRFSRLENKRAVLQVHLLKLQKKKKKHEVVRDYRRRYAVNSKRNAAFLITSKSQHFQKKKKMLLAFDKHYDLPRKTCVLRTTVYTHTHTHIFIHTSQPHSPRLNNNKSCVSLPVFQTMTGKMRDILLASEKRDSAFPPYYSAPPLSDHSKTSCVQLIRRLFAPARESEAQQTCSRRHPRRAVLSPARAPTVSSSACSPARRKRSDRGSRQSAARGGGRQNEIGCHSQCMSSGGEKKVNI